MRETKDPASGIPSPRNQVHIIFNSAVIIKQCKIMGALYVMNCV